MTQLATLQDKAQVLTDACMPSAKSIDAALYGDRTILEVTPGRFFRNVVPRVRWNPNGAVEISMSSEAEDFMSMLSRRNDTTANSALWGDPENGLQKLSSGLELSNVGISIALTTAIDGDRFALLARRAGANGMNRLMLPSGYTDARKFFAADGSGLQVRPDQLFIGNAALEGSEELLVPRAPGWFSPTQLSGKLIESVAGELAIQVGSQLERVGSDTVQIAPSYEELDYDLNTSWKLTFSGLPSYIHNVFQPPKVNIEGVELDGVGVQQHMHTNSGQLIFGGECQLPLENRELISLLHAEDGPLANASTRDVLNAAGVPGDMLATRLDRNGLILAKLDEAGQITPQYYNFFHGSLVPATDLGDVDTIVFSDAFVPSPLEGCRGLVDRADISAREFFKIR